MNRMVHAGHHSRIQHRGFAAVVAGKVGTTEAGPCHNHASVTIAATAGLILPCRA